MYLHGSFTNRINQTIAVHILTNADRTTALEIGSEATDIWFDGDSAVEINSSVNDTLDPLLRSEAVIRLLAPNIIPDLYCPSARNAVVNIYQDNQLVFAGFVEPRAYAQDYNEQLDTIEINCIDALSALQYSLYGGIGINHVSYDQAKDNAAEVTMLQILQDISQSFSTHLDILHAAKPTFIYDGSKSLTDSPDDRYAIFSQIALQELLFYGDSEDEVWAYDTVLQEILRFLSLHMLQLGTTFYIFSWDSLKAGTPIQWQTILPDDHSSGGAGLPATTVTISNSNVADKATTIEIPEVFNRIELTIDTKKVDTTVESPLSGDGLIKAYPNKQLYMREFSSKGEGEHAWNAFRDMVHGKPTTYSGAIQTDWFLWVKKNIYWKFIMRQMQQDGQILQKDLVYELTHSRQNQQDLPNYLRDNIAAAIISWGYIDKELKADDDTPVSDVSMTDCLVVSVNGGGDRQGIPSEQDLLNSCPVATYRSGSRAMTLSPADPDEKNYIVISGTVILNPLMPVTGNFYDLYYNRFPYTDMQGQLQPYVDDHWRYYINDQERRAWWHQTVQSPDRGNADGRYYARQFFAAKTPSHEPSWDVKRASQGLDGLIPFTNHGEKLYKYTHSRVGANTDQISKVAVLACMLIVGDKCVVEKTPDNDLGTSIPYTGKGQPDDFVWMPYRTRQQCNTDEEYYAQSFTIGFNPAIDDYLVGQEHKLQLNYNYTEGLTGTDGTAIPIRQQDMVSGPVQFHILGPVNLLTSNTVAYRDDQAFWKQSKWGANGTSILENIANIIIKNFQVRIETANQTPNDDDGDLIYVSDTDDSFLNKLDDLHLKIHSALTASERQELGIAAGVFLGIAVNKTTGLGLLAIHDNINNITAKPEQLLVDEIFREYHTPHTILQQNFQDTGNNVSPFNTYRHPAMTDTLYVQAISRDLDNGQAKLTLKSV